MVGERPDWLFAPDAAFTAEYKPAHNATRAYLHRVLLRALEPSLERVPTSDQIAEKPLDVRLGVPLPARLRFYLYGATQHASERQQGTFKVQLTNGVPSAAQNRLHFDRSEGVRPILAGYQLDLGVFILWDAELHDQGVGFSYSKNVQAPPDLVWGAAARGLATAERRLKRPAAREVIVGARPHYLRRALEMRIRLSNDSLIGDSDA